LLYAMALSLSNGKRAGANPWRALTLEWATTSPPPTHNFHGDPVPYRDPYGYGTESAFRYLEDVDRRYGVGERDDDKVPVPALRGSGD